MMRAKRPDQNTVKLASDHILAKGLAAAAVHFGVAPATLQRLAQGLPVAGSTLEQVKPRVRKAEEFATGARTAVSPPVRSLASMSWPLEAIRKARDAQMRGDFRLAVRLAEAMRTDDAMYVAYHNRIAPQTAVNALLTPASGARGQAVCSRAMSSCMVSRSVLSGIDGTMANHGLAIGYNEHDTNDKGTRVDFRLTEWPLEWVQYRPNENLLYTATKHGEQVPIIHGDGRWTIFRKFWDRPWLQEAAVIPGSFIYASHANGAADWSGASRSHGLVKVIGELPVGISMQGKDASGRPILSPEAEAILAMLTAVINGDSEVGLRPAGSKTDILQNSSTAWQVFSELMLNREKAAARVYLGTDGMLGAAGGAPGVDISQLFGVATTKVQGDLSALEQGLSVGVYQPWTAMNCGDSRYAPGLIYQLPDPDRDTRSEQKRQARKRLADTIKEMKENDLTVDQPVVDQLAKEFGVSPVPQLAAAGDSKVTVVLAPTDVAKVTKGIEARSANGLPPFNDERDNMTIAEIDQAAAAKAQAANNPTPPPAPAPAPVA